MLSAAVRSRTPSRATKAIPALTQANLKRSYRIATVVRGKYGALNTQLTLNASNGEAHKRQMKARRFRVGVDSLAPVSVREWEARVAAANRRHMSSSTKNSDNVDVNPTSVDIAETEGEFVEELHSKFLEGAAEDAPIHKPAESPVVYHAREIYVEKEDVQELVQEVQRNSDPELDYEYLVEPTIEIAETELFPDAESRAVELDPEDVEKLDKRSERYSSTLIEMKDLAKEFVDQEAEFGSIEKEVLDLLAQKGIDVDTEALEAFNFAQFETHIDDVLTAPVEEVVVEEEKPKGRDLSPAEFATLADEATRATRFDKEEVRVEEELKEDTEASLRAARIEDMKGGAWEDKFHVETGDEGNKNEAMEKLYELPADLRVTPETFAEIMQLREEEMASRKGHAIQVNADNEADDWDDEAEHVMDNMSLAPDYARGRIPTTKREWDLIRNGNTDPLLGIEKGTDTDKYLALFNATPGGTGLLMEEVPRVDVKTWIQIGQMVEHWHVRMEGQQPKSEVGKMNAEVARNDGEDEHFHVNIGQMATFDLFKKEEYDVLPKDASEIRPYPEDDEDMFEHEEMVDREDDRLVDKLVDEELNEEEESEKLYEDDCRRHLIRVMKSYGFKFTPEQSQKLMDDFIEIMKDKEYPPPPSDEEALQILREAQEEFDQENRDNAKGADEFVGLVEEGIFPENASESEKQAYSDKVDRLLEEAKAEVEAGPPDVTERMEGPFVEDDDKLMTGPISQTAAAQNIRASVDFYRSLVPESDFADCIPATSTKYEMGDPAYYMTEEEQMKMEEENYALESVDENLVDEDQLARDAWKNADMLRITLTSRYDINQLVHLGFGPEHCTLSEDELVDVVKARKRTSITESDVRDLCEGSMKELDYDLIKDPVEALDMLDDEDLPEDDRIDDASYQAHRLELKQEFDPHTVADLVTETRSKIEQFDARATSKVIKEVHFAPPTEEEIADPSSGIVKLVDEHNTEFYLREGSWPVALDGTIYSYDLHGAIRDDKFNTYDQFRMTKEDYFNIDTIRTEVKEQNAFDTMHIALPGSQFELKDEVDVDAEGQFARVALRNELPIADNACFSDHLELKEKELPMEQYFYYNEDLTSVDNWSLNTLRFEELYTRMNEDLEVDEDHYEEYENEYNQEGDVDVMGQDPLIKPKEWSDRAEFDMMRSLDPFSEGASIRPGSMLSEVNGGRTPLAMQELMYQLNFEDPGKWSAKRLSEQFALSLDRVRAILKLKYLEYRLLPGVKREHPEMMYHANMDEDHYLKTVRGEEQPMNKNQYSNTPQVVDPLAFHIDGMVNYFYRPSLDLEEHVMEEAAIEKYSPSDQVLDLSGKQTTELFADRSSTDDGIEEGPGDILAYNFEQELLSDDELDDDEFTVLEYQPRIDVEEEITLAKETGQDRYVKENIPNEIQHFDNVDAQNTWKYNMAEEEVEEFDEDDVVIAWDPVYPKNRRMFTEEVLVDPLDAVQLKEKDDAKWAWKTSRANNVKPRDSNLPAADKSPIPNLPSHKPIPYNFIVTDTSTKGENLSVKVLKTDGTFRNPSKFELAAAVQNEVPFMWNRNHGISSDQPQKMWGLEDDFLSYRSRSEPVPGHLLHLYDPVFVAAAQHTVPTTTMVSTLPEEYEDLVQLPLAQVARGLIDKADDDDDLDGLRDEITALANKAPGVTEESFSKYYGDVTMLETENPDMYPKASMEVQEVPSFEKYRSLEKDLAAHVENHHEESLMEAVEHHSDSLFSKDGTFSEESFAELEESIKHVDRVEGIKAGIRYRADGINGEDLNRFSALDRNTDATMYHLAEKISDETITTAEAKAFAKDSFKVQNAGYVQNGRVYKHYTPSGEKKST